MEGFIDGYNFKEMEAMKYYAPKAGDTKAPAEAKSKIFSGEWLGTRKMDGYFAKFVKDEDGNMFLLSRSRGVDGNFSEKIDKVPQFMPFFNELPNGTCFLGELYIHGREGSNEVTKLLGSLTPKAIARQAKEEDKLHFYIFDCLAYNNKSYINLKASERFKFINCFIDDHNYIEFAWYESGEELWGTLQEILASGGEGMVITYKDAIYEPGKRSKKITLKVKKELSETIDCFFTGKVAAPAKYYTGKEIDTWKYWINEVTGEKFEGDYAGKFINDNHYAAITKSYFKGYAGSLEIGVLDGDTVIPLGYISGLPDEIKENWKDHIHEVVEVGAMQWTDDKKLRHGRIVSYRKPEDKSWKECTIDQIK